VAKEEERNDAEQEAAGDGDATNGQSNMTVREFIVVVGRKMVQLHIGKEEIQ